MDEAGQVFVEEVNTNGFLVGDDELFKAQEDTVDMMRVIGADDFPKRPLYASHAANLVNRFLNTEGYDEHDGALIKDALLSTIHEEVAAFPTSWVRIFPHQLHFGHEQLLNQSLAFATDLDQVLADFLRWRLNHPLDRMFMSEAGMNVTANAWVRKNQKRRSFEGIVASEM